MHIDWWTLALQTVNVLILIWLLSRFLYRPLLALLERRRAAAGAMLTDAKKARAEAQAIRAEAEAVRSGILADRERLVHESHAAAQAQAATELAQAAERIAKLRAEAAAEIARGEAAAASLLTERARELALDIAQRLLARLPPAAALTAFLDGLCAEIGKLAPGLSPGAGEAIEITTAAPLTPADEEMIRAALAAAFGAPHPFSWRADPAVIAGIELRTPHALICNSFRADLTRISQELKQDGEQGGETRKLA